MIIIHGLCYGQFLFCYSPNFSVKKKICCASRAALSRLHLRQWRMFLLYSALVVSCVIYYICMRRPRYSTSTAAEVILVKLQRLAYQRSW